MTYLEKLKENVEKQREDVNLKQYIQDAIQQIKHYLEEVENSYIIVEQFRKDVVNVKNNKNSFAEGADAAMEGLLIKFRSRKYIYKDALIYLHEEKDKL